VAGVAVLVGRAGLHTYQFPNKVLPILASVSSPIDPVRIVDFRPFIASRRRRNARASSLTRGSSRVGGGSGVGGGVGAGIFGTLGAKGPMHIIVLQSGSGPAIAVIGHSVLPVIVNGGFADGA